MKIQLAEFPQDGKTWLLSWLGRVLAYARRDGQPQIIAHLSEVHSDCIDPLSNTSQTGAARSVEVPVGYVGMLKQGSVWINGIRQRSEKINVIRLIVDPRKSRLLRFDEPFDRFGYQGPLIHKGNYHIRAGYPKFARSWYVAIHEPEYLSKDRTRGPRIVILPSTSIFQKCCSPTSAAANFILTGRLHQIVDTRRSRVCPDDARIYLAHLNKDFRQQDVSTFVHLLTDEQAIREYSRMRNCVIADNIRKRSHNDESAHIQFGLPFSAPFEAEIEGKWIRIKKGSTSTWGFLGLWIRKLQPLLPFDSIVVSRDRALSLDASSHAASDDRAHGTRKAKPRTPDAFFTSDQPPEPDATPFELPELGLGLDTPDIQIISANREQRNYESHKELDKAESAQATQANASDIHETGSKVTPTSVNAEPLPEPHWSIEVFIAALMKLITRGIKITTINIGEHQERCCGQIVNYYPKLRKDLRRWHLNIDLYGNPPRGFVVAHVIYAGQHIYFIEIERRAGEDRSIAKLHPQQEGPLSASRIEDFMQATADNKGWPKEGYAHFGLNFIRHPAHKAQPDDDGKKDLIDALSNRLGRAISGEPT